MTAKRQDAVITVAQDHRKKAITMLGLNASAASLLGYETADVMGQKLEFILTREGKARIAEMVEFEEDGPELDESLGKLREIGVQPRQGKALSLALKVMRAVSEDGQLLFHLLLRDNSLRRAMDADAKLPQTSRQFSLDAATGLPEGFHLRKEYELAAGLREGNDLVPSTLALISVDGYAGIVERFGRQAADRLIGSVGALFIKNLREVDTVTYQGEGRLGLVLIGADTPGAHVALGRLRWLMSANMIRLEDGASENFTVSAGFSEIRADADYDRTREACLKALRWAEESGGNFAQGALLETA